MPVGNTSRFVKIWVAKIRLPNLILFGQLSPHTSPELVQQEGDEDLFRLFFKVILEFVALRLLLTKSFRPRPPIILQYWTASVTGYQFTIPKIS
jgi:hypothetical protein